MDDANLALPIKALRLSTLLAYQSAVAASRCSSCMPFTNSKWEDFQWQISGDTDHVRRAGACLIAEGGIRTEDEGPLILSIPAQKLHHAILTG